MDVLKIGKDAISKRHENLRPVYYDFIYELCYDCKSYDCLRLAKFRHNFDYFHVRPKV